MAGDRALARQTVATPGQAQESPHRSDQIPEVSQKARNAHPAFGFPGPVGADPTLGGGVTSQLECSRPEPPAGSLGGRCPAAEEPVSTGSLTLAQSLWGEGWV